MQSDVEHLAKLVKGITFTMFTTINPVDGTLRSRPMTLQEGDFQGDFWFFAGKDGTVTEDISHHERVNLAFSNPKNNDYVSVTGVAEVVEDRKKAEQLWTPALKAWFPEGVSDPNLTLIRVAVQSADYWEAPNSKVASLIGFAKAIITGKRAEDIGKRGHVDIN